MWEKILRDKLNPGSARYANNHKILTKEAEDIGEFVCLGTDSSEGQPHSSGSADIMNDREKANGGFSLCCFKTLKAKLTALRGKGRM